MFNYHRPHEFLVNHLSFEVDSMSYVGSGFLQWNPMQGFHLLARVQHLGDPVLKRSIRQLTVTRRTVLRMRIGKMQHAFAPNVYVDDSHLMTDHLSIDFSRVIFVQRGSRDLSRDNWSGQALLKTTTSSILPDRVRKETTIGEGKPHWGLSMSGIDHRDTSGLSIQGMRNEDQIEVFWSLPRSHKAKQQSWCIPEGLCSALTVLDGTVPRLLFREVNRIGCTYREVWAPRQPSSLGIIFRPHDAGRIDRNHLVRLTTFFAQESHEAIICRQMLGQMIEAARQQTWQARELLLSMIFEAVLRYLLNNPWKVNANAILAFV